VAWVCKPKPVWRGPQGPHRQKKNFPQNASSAGFFLVLIFMLFSDPYLHQSEPIGFNSAFLGQWPYGALLFLNLSLYEHPACPIPRGLARWVEGLGQLHVIANLINLNKFCNFVIMATMSHSERCPSLSFLAHFESSATEHILCGSSVRHKIG
jgi:hypothetical protein